MVDVDQFDDLKGFLSSCVSSLKKRFPNYSSSQLAKVVDVTQSSFNRIENSDVKRPCFNTAFKIVRMACGEEKVQAFIERFYPEMSKTIQRIYPGNADVPFVAPEAESFFENVASFEIMILATGRAGVTRKRIEKEFGTRGLQTLDTLLGKQLVSEVDGKFTFTGKINAKQETVHKLLQNLVSMSYDVNAFGEKLNWLSVQYESVNLEKAMPVLMEIMRKTYKEIRETFSSPEFEGQDVVWAGLVLDALSKNAGKSSQGQELLQ